MNINLNFKNLVIVTLLSGCISMNTSAKNDLVPETTAEQIEHGYWDNPNLDYISTPWPINDEGLVDIRVVPLLDKGFITTTPVDRNEGVTVGELGINGGNKDMIVKLAQEMSDGLHGDFDSLLITHKNKLVFESYYSRGRLNLTHPQASATKTYTGLALGRAIQLGYLSMADLDKPLTSFLKELDSSKFVDGIEKVTLHQALTMRSGIRIIDEKGEEFEKYRDQLKGQNLIQAIFEQSDPVTSESQRAFSYGNYSTPLVMQVIDAVVPGSAEDFIKNELLDKIGISTYEWRTGLGGLPAGGWKSSFSSRDMMKFGILAINKGKWNGEQLIPEVYIAKAISRIVTTDDDVKIFGGGNDVSNQGYGYFWWSGDLKVGDKSYFSTSAQGGSGQFIILVEALDLVIVATGSHRGSGGKNLQIAAERILPAFIENASPTMNVSQNKLPILKGPYLGQKPPGLIPEIFAPDVVSINGRSEGSISFSPDLGEIYFGAKSRSEVPAIYFSRLESNKWTPIEKAAFTKGKRDQEENPLINHNGKRIYFTAFSSDHSDTRIWYVNRLGRSWSDAIKLELHDDDKVLLEGLTKRGDLYYYNFSKGKSYYAAYNNGGFPEPREFEFEPGFFHPFFSQDEDYLVAHGLNKEDEGREDSDIYVSFKEQDGTWATPINLGSAVNSNAKEGSATISPDGKYLFFSRDEEDGTANVYWVSTEVIERLRPN